MKRYILFAFNEYYPCGGLNDLEGHFDDLESIAEYIKHMEYESDFFQVLDTQETNILYYQDGEFL